TARAVVASLSGVFFFFSSRRRHTRFSRDWSSDVCSSDLYMVGGTMWVESRLRIHPQVWIALGMIAAGTAGIAAWFAGKPFLSARSEERRVGKECRTRWAPCQCKEKQSERGRGVVVIRASS